MNDVTKYDVILSPVITEKSTNASEHNKVTFRVRLDATKSEIRAAIEKLWPKVKVVQVNTILTKGKRKQFRGTQFKKSDVKKAVVTLAEGSSIDVTTGL